MPKTTGKMYISLIASNLRVSWSSSGTNIGSTLVELLLKLILQFEQRVDVISSKTRAWYLPLDIFSFFQSWNEEISPKTTPFIYSAYKIYDWSFDYYFLLLILVQYLLNITKITYQEEISIQARPLKSYFPGPTDHENWKIETKNKTT